MSNKVYVVIIAVLLGIVAWMAYSLNNKDKEYIYVKEEYANLDEERMALAVDLETMKMKYDSMTVDNAEMNDKIMEQSDELEALLQKVKNEDYDIKKLKAEAETLRSIMKNYIHQIDSLNQANIQLTAERNAQASRADQAEARGHELEGELNVTKEMVNKGSVLSTGEYQNSALFERNNGKQVSTERAAKTEMIKSCFKLRKNQITKPGLKKIYLSVVGPDGKVLQGSNSGAISIDGAEKEYSVTREIDYQQTDTDVCIYYTAPADYKFNKGSYKIFLYENGHQIGQSDISLK